MRSHAQLLGIVYAKDEKPVLRLCSRKSAFKRSMFILELFNRVAVTSRKWVGPGTVVMKAMLPSLLVGIPEYVAIHDIAVRNLWFSDDKLANATEPFGVGSVR